MSTTTQDAPAPAEEPAPVRRSAARRGLKIGAILAVAVLAGFLLVRVAFGTLTPHLYSGTVFRVDTAAPDLDGLFYASGEPVDLAAFEGDLVLVYFGYTHCPDVCPSTLFMTASAIRSLSESDQERVHLLMVSVDPARDDVDSLQEYVEFFDAGFLGVGGDVASIDRAASLYGIYYEIGEGDVESGYTVDHTATLMGIGTDGTLRIVWPPDSTTDPVAADLKELLS